MGTSWRNSMKWQIPPMSYVLALLVHHNALFGVFQLFSLHQSWIVQFKIQFCPWIYWIEKLLWKNKPLQSKKTPANEKTVLGAAKKIRSLPAITACIPYSFRLIAWSGYWHWPAKVKFMLKKCPYSKPQYEKFHWLRLPKLCQRISFNSWSKPKCNAKCFVPLSILHKKGSDNMKSSTTQVCRAIKVPWLVVRGGATKLEGDL